MMKILLSKFSRVTLGAFLLSFSFFTAEAACDNPAFIEGATRAYSAGDIISRNGIDYKVTIAGWANNFSSDWAYAPGTGSQWTAAWSLENDPCTDTGGGGSETCSDGIKNQDETGIDCGGSTCSPCSGGETCSDGIQNQDETGIDCGGSTCSPCGGSGGGGGNGSACSSTTYTNGYATFYNLLDDGASSIVKCSYDAVGDIKGTKYGALHKTMLNETPAKYCGMCVEMTGSAGTATLQIVDECPTCTHSSEDIDLSPNAFAAIVGDESIGIENISWIEVSCPWTEPIEVIFQGSNYSYAKVIIAKHVNRISKVEIGSGGTFHEMVRGTDNGWIKSGFGGAWNNFIMDVKVTDIYGEEIIVTGLSLESNPTNSTTAGTGNFPACGLATSSNAVNTLNYVTAYPNPANSSITFEGLGDVQTIDIVNVNGVVVATQFLGGAHSTASLDVSSLAPGIYVARMKGISTAGTTTFIKK